ncbi:MAG: ClbS/DfsB family four-helix bundle protein [Dehalococcoidia bacterium]
MLDPAVMEALPLPTSKSELLERIPPARQVLESLIDGLSEAQMVRTDGSGWSIKDHLAHLATWERMIVAHLRAGNDHEVVGLDDVSYAAAGLDELNAMIEEQHKDQPLAEVLDDFHRSHAAIVAEISRLSDDDLSRPYWHNDPSQRTVLAKVSGDTYRHYLEHRHWILDLLNRSPPG